MEKNLSVWSVRVINDLMHIINQYIQKRECLALDIVHARRKTAEIHDESECNYIRAQEFLLSFTQVISILLLKVKKNVS